MLRAFIAVAAVSVFAACTPSPEELCNTAAETTCKKQYECNKDAASKIFGADEAACVTFVKTLAKCAEKKTEADLCTGSSAGKKFNLGNADTCNDAALAQNCEDVKAGKIPDPACEKVCE